MARRKVTNRIPRIQPNRGRAGSVWDRTFLGTVPQTNQVAPSSYLDITATRAQAARLTDQRLVTEIEMAVNGDDEALLPYQPTPTINPGRPRTLAAGYD